MHSKDLAEGYILIPMSILSVTHLGRDCQICRFFANFSKLWSFLETKLPDISKVTTTLKINFTRLKGVLRTFNSDTPKFYPTLGNTVNWKILKIYVFQNFILLYKPIGEFFTIISKCAKYHLPWCVISKIFNGFKQKKWSRPPLPHPPGRDKRKKCSPPPPSVMIFPPTDFLLTFPTIFRLPPSLQVPPGDNF